VKKKKKPKLHHKKQNPSTKPPGKRKHTKTQKPLGKKKEKEGDAFSWAMRGGIERKQKVDDLLECDSKKFLNRSPK